MVESSSGSELPFTGTGFNVNSGEFDGLKTGKAKKAVMKKLETLNMGGEKVRNCEKRTTTARSERRQRGTKRRRYGATRNN